MSRTLRTRLTGIAVAAVVAFLAPFGAATARAAAITPSGTTYDVRDFGATGDGTTNDAPAIDCAIAAANAAGGGTVEFPPEATSPAVPSTCSAT